MKEAFRTDLDDVLVSLPRQKRAFIGAGLNGHVGEENTGDEEEVTGKNGCGQRNSDGQTVVDFAKRMVMALTNTYFEKEKDNRETCRS